MEDNIQTIIIAIISVFLLFIFPVYMAYEKKDDISYALAMRYTQDLVDEVRSKGYITRNMYDDYRARLKLTGNTYDIALTHEYNRYDPITNYYTMNESGTYELLRTTTQEVRKENEDAMYRQALTLGKLQENSTQEQIDEYFSSEYLKQNIYKVEDTFNLSKEIYNTNHIMNSLNSNKKLLLNSNEENVICSDDETSEVECQYAYIMNIDDNFNVTIKNTNVTLATLMYNMVTANTLDSNTRIYVNYGGAILSSKWYGDIDYSKLKLDSLSLDEFQEIFKFDGELHFYNNNYPVKKVDKAYEGEYIVEFDVKPTEVIELRKKGVILDTDFSKDNFALGHTDKNMLSVSVGLNGISLIKDETNKLVSQVEAKYNMPTYTEYIYSESNEIIEEHEVYRDITDYGILAIEYVSKGKLRVTLISKNPDVQNETSVIEVEDADDLLKEFNYSLNNPNRGLVSGKFGTNNVGVSYKVNITYSGITIEAIKEVSGTTTLLSYPVSIDEYVRVRIEMMMDRDLGEYIAILYLDDERVAKSIGLGTDASKLPRINQIGQTNIGGNTRSFLGWIRNLIIYN